MTGSVYQQISTGRLRRGEARAGTGKTATIILISLGRAMLETLWLGQCSCFVCVQIMAGSCFCLGPSCPNNGLVLCW